MKWAVDAVRLPFFYFVKTGIHYSGFRSHHFQSEKRTRNIVQAIDPATIHTSCTQSLKFRDRKDPANFFFFIHKVEDLKIVCNDT
jgi:hypothetical protein